MANEKLTYQKDDPASKYNYLRHMAERGDRKAYNYIQVIHRDDKQKLLEARILRGEIKETT